ncbi:hypothetical protein SAMN05421538_103184 [Paracoccus isoporae]|uniref:Lipoprotein n=1 Tax=Paracoccus isoporae TaxID=591205 RepID=A0A1G6Z872_9RHOB|nr:hypothetical protein [Paracoccus isoporae]SDD98672.1 hypothetical protein SAMN05421538_103184 [Paracoccus isoporae]
MLPRLIAFAALLALAACASTPERRALDDFNSTVGTANQTVSNIRLIRSLVD